MNDDAADAEGDAEMLGKLRSQRSWRVIHHDGVVVNPHADSPEAAARRAVTRRFMHSYAEAVRRGSAEPSYDGAIYFVVVSTDDGPKMFSVVVRERLDHDGHRCFSFAEARPVL